MSASPAQARPKPDPGWLWAASFAVIAFAIRLAVVLRGGGLFGRIGYDGAVYYASASALAHGYLPYRDFLLLHPPGITLALLPFAALGRVFGDPYAYALARLAWFGFGAASTALVYVVVRSRGLVPAAVAAACYAVFVPAVVSEHTTSLEAVGSVCLLGSLALLTRGRGVAPSRFSLVAAGALLGFSSATKIWAVAVGVVVVIWAFSRLGARRGSLVLAGAVGAVVLACLPFFIAAPGSMWRMVVLDQLGRRRVSESLAGRVADIAGLSQLRHHSWTGALAVAVLVVGACVLTLTLGDTLGRLVAAVLVVGVGVLLASPPWSVAYTGLVAPAVAVLLGCAVARSADLNRRLRSAVPVLVVLGLVGYSVVSLPSFRPGSRFPGRTLEASLAHLPGCVTTDDPIALIETGALRRNFERGCPVVVDLSGYSYDLQPAASRQLSRPHNEQWQRVVVEHLGSGRASVEVRFRTLTGFSRATKEVVGSWPVLTTVGGYRLREPAPRTISPFR